jgi:hypothetical protein
MDTQILDFTSDWLAAGTWVDPLTALIGAFVFGQVLGWTYEFTFRGLSYSRGFSHAIVLVCVSAAILVLAMQHSLLAGLGLFGVLSMIRFRTDLKTPRDLVFVMGAACIGVACGVDAIVTACIGTAMFSGIAIYLQLGPFGSRTRYDGVLRFCTPMDADNGQELKRLFERHCLRQSLLSISDVGGTREHVYQVKFLREPDREALLLGLRTEFDANDARLMLQDATSEY